MPSGFESLSIALALTYVGIFGYVLYLHVVQRRLQREVAIVQEALRAGGKK